MRTVRVASTYALAAIFAAGLAVPAGCTTPKQPAERPTGSRLGDAAVAASQAASQAAEAAAPDTPTPAPPTVEEPAAPAAAAPPVFDAERAMADIRALADLGVRQAGSDAERGGAEYLAGRLREMGYEPRIEEFPLPNGKTSRNVVASSGSTSGRYIVLGAHMDSKSPSPGANDNASGCAALLEIARVLAGRPLAAGLEIVFFGSEEMIDSNANHHHYGSRHQAGTLSAAQRAERAAMISVDMIGYGSSVHARNMGVGPQTAAVVLRRFAVSKGLPMTYLKDPSKVGWSDHEAYEKAGIPAVWVEWREDPVYHTAKDTPSHVKPELVRRTGQMLCDFLIAIDSRTLAELDAR